MPLGTNGLAANLGQQRTTLLRPVGEGLDKGCSQIILDSLWSAYAALLSNPKLRPAVASATEDRERGITRLLYFELGNLLSGNEPFHPLHGAPEDESRKRAPARPRAYDIAFAMRENPRIM